jgi:hypothetical protein
MNRPLAFLCVLFFAFVSISSACVAQPSKWMHFILEPNCGNSGKIHASFREENRGHDDNSWSTGFEPSELVGLDVPSFRGSGTRPIKFAIVREAGRLDCNGNGGGNYASGNCTFTTDPAFTQLLISRGIGRPTPEQAFGLMAVNARHEMLDAVAAAHYPTPTIDNLVALSALGVDGRYITEMSRAGYRPQSIQKVIEFKALGITPEWIGGFVRIGYANLPGDGLVQLRALGITPDFIEGFTRIGYGNLPVSTLVQLKSLDITPEFVRSVAQPGAPVPAPNELVQLKLFGKRR